MCKRRKRNSRKKDIHMINKHVVRLLNFTNQENYQGQQQFNTIMYQQIDKEFFKKSDHIE